MTFDTTVICPGVVFSSLLSEQLSLSEIQEGFLLGSSVEHTSTQISDLDINNEKTNKIIHISSYHCMDYLGCLYDGCGKLRQESLDAVQHMAHQNNQEIIGWYSRRCSDFWDRVFLRQKLVHYQLRDQLNIPGLLYMTCNWKKDGVDAFPATHCLVFACPDKKFQRQSLEIGNLGNTSNSDYKLAPPNPSVYTSPATRGEVTSVQCKEPGVEEATQLHARLESALQRQLQHVSTAHERHTERLTQLMSLRSFCYLNGVVPDAELSTSMVQEKESDSIQADKVASEPSTGETNKTSPPQVSSNVVNKERKKTPVRHLTANGKALGANDVRRGRSPAKSSKTKLNQSTSSSTDEVNNALENLQVSNGNDDDAATESVSTTKNTVTTRNKSSNPSSRSTSNKGGMNTNSGADAADSKSSSNGRHSEASASPPRKKPSDSLRGSRPTSATKQKSRTNSSSSSSPCPKAPAWKS